MSEPDKNPPESEPSLIIKYPKPNEGGAGAKATLGLTSETVASAILTADSLAIVEISRRENIVGSWFRQGDLGFVFGVRGLGKTWLALDIARGIAAGEKVGPWPVSNPRKVLYVDGEMPLDGIRDRIRSLGGRGDTLAVLNHEWIFQKCGAVLNLSDKSAQVAVSGVCEARGIEVVILDNLSCLFTGIAENDADAWETVLPWLLALRRRKIAVVIVHHAGRSGQHMRGTSRREDAAFWVLRLDQVPDASNGHAAFVTRFTKSRQGAEAELEPLEWRYRPDGDRITVNCKAVSGVELFKQWIRDGLTTCSEIADEMGVSKGTVSKLAARGEQEGWLKKVGRQYKLTET